MNGPQTDLDQAAFQRVWRRVMPQDRADCPFTLDPAQEAAEPTPPQSAPLHTDETPAPAVPAQIQPPTGAMTSLALQTMPAPPASSPSPAVPAVQRPMPAPGTAPSPCLGESAMGELPTLEVLIGMVWEGRQLYRILTRPARTRSHQAALLGDLMAAKDHQLRRLRTAHFLISGREFELSYTPPRRFGSLPLALRDRYHAEQAFALRCLTAAGRSADPCLIDLYRALASQSQALAGSLREALEGS